MTTVSLIQLDAQPPEKSGDALAAVRQRIEDASDSDLIVLPEIWYPGYFAFDEYERAADATPALLEAFSAMAASASSCLHVGSLIEAADGNHYNTSVLFGPDGSELARYRKMHLFGFGSKEQQVLTAGTDIVVADTPLGKLGMAVCYDLRFPELFRRMTERGAIGFIVASAWPHPRIEAWNTLLRARAIENQAFMFACNGVGDTGASATLCGRSAIVDPWGVTVASLGDDAATATAAVDMAAADATRDRFPALADRQLLGEPDNDLVLRRDDGRSLRFSAKRLILAGYTSRDADAVAAYIAKLEEEGIAPPDEVPSYFVLGADRLTTADSIEVATPSSCGEVEFALLIDDDDIWVAAASDHTDRGLETVDIPASKQSCVKVLSTTVWRLADIEEHWDELRFEARNPADAEAAYQSGSVAALRPPAELIALVNERFGGPMTGTVILSGTIPANGEFEFHPTFAAELHDPIRARSLSATYSITNVLEEK
jgi:predicted amidohydrolase